MNCDTIVRTPLLSAALGDRNVSRVEVREIVFQPRQQTGRHFHPCPVVGYIAEGTAILQVDGGAALTLPAGSAFHEPARATIARFDKRPRQLR